MSATTDLERPPTTGLRAWRRGADAGAAFAIRDTASDCVGAGLAVKGEGALAEAPNHGADPGVVTGAASSAGRALVGGNDPKGRNGAALGLQSDGIFVAAESRGEGGGSCSDNRAAELGQTTGATFAGGGK